MRDIVDVKFMLTTAKQKTKLLFSSVLPHMLFNEEFLLVLIQFCHLSARKQFMVVVVVVVVVVFQKG